MLTTFLICSTCTHNPLGRYAFLIYVPSLMLAENISFQPLKGPVKSLSPSLILSTIVTYSVQYVVEQIAIINSLLDCQDSFRQGLAALKTPGAKIFMKYGTPGQADDSDGIRAQGSWALRRWLRRR